jgi:hypothetical protein
MIQPVGYPGAAYSGYNYPMPTPWGYPGYYPMYPMPMYHPASMNPGWYPAGY